MDTNADQVDVAIVGYGPVGQALAAMLGAAGHSVAVVERWPDLFPLPRAGHIDHEVMRIFQSLGIAEELEADSWKLTGYELRDRNDDVLHSFDWGHDDISGWYSDYSLFQPHLESLLHGRVSALPNVELLRGWQTESVALGSGDDDVTLVARHGTASGGAWIPGERTRTISARYVVGCDGANSIVRETAGLELEDFGFEADWLVVFVEPLDPAMRIDMPDVAQLLDPRRPTTAFRSSGARFPRWEFMLMEGETPESMSTPEAAWGLIERWGLTPENARLVRNTVFRFRSKVAPRWRSGRALLAGDAAHLMPPFLGQGMCSGLRDAKTLTWKLDLVLNGIAPESLLDSYESERQPHVAEIVRASLRLGELICVTDDAEAAARDDRLRTGAAAPPAPLPGLRGGVLHRGADGAPLGAAGQLSVQGRVDVDGRLGRMDDVVGGGWTVLVTGFDPEEELGAASWAVLRTLDAHVVRVEAAPAGDAVGDVDMTYLPWLLELGSSAVVVRPDFYVFGTAASPGALDDLVGDLRAQLGLAAAVIGDGELTSAKLD